MSDRTPLRVAVLTVSDAASRGEREDRSGAACVAWAVDRGDVVVAAAVVSDDADRIVRALVAWSDGGAIDLALTTGGTGLGPRDITPEATRAALDREAPGIAEHLRATTARGFPRAVLSRGVAGARGRTLIVNLPGSPGGVRECLAALAPIVDHACAVLGARVTEHAESGSDAASLAEGQGGDA